MKAESDMSERPRSEREATSARKERMRRGATMYAWQSGLHLGSSSL